MTSSSLMLYWHRNVNTHTEYLNLLHSGREIAFELRSRVLKTDAFDNSTPKDGRFGPLFRALFLEKEEDYFLAINLFGKVVQYDLISKTLHEISDSGNLNNLIYDIGYSEFTIYEMMKGCSVWSVRYRVDTDDFMTPLPEGWLIQSTVWSIVLGEREEDSFLVINLSGKNVETASGFPSDTVRSEWRRRHHDMQRRHDSRQEESPRTFDGITASGNHSTLHRRIVKLLEVLQDTAINDNHDDDDELLHHFKALLQGCD
ncbi:hypothetical protein Tco_0996706 [Tanacetum coccineum]